jgi:hypothetical protein
MKDFSRLMLAGKNFTFNPKPKNGSSVVLILIRLVVHDIQSHPDPTQMALEERRQFSIHEMPPKNDPNNPAIIPMPNSNIQARKKSRRPTHIHRVLIHATTTLYYCRYCCSKKANFSRDHLLKSEGQIMFCRILFQLLAC